MLSRLKGTTALVAAALMMPPPSAALAQATGLYTVQPQSSDPLVTQYFTNPAQDPNIDSFTMAKLLQSKIKYVFVIFNENESFDHEYGTFPGANGIYSDGTNPRPDYATPGFYQTYVDSVTHLSSTVTPFLLTPQQNSTVIDSVDHSHTGLAFKIDVSPTWGPMMDKFSQDEFNNKAGTTPSAASEAKGRQYANIVMSHIDCNTIPFYWQYANRFALFDNIFATEDTPSTPNAVAMLAGQAGESQWVKHGTAGMTGPLAGTINGVNYNGQTGTTQGPPLVNDPQPYWGSEFDANRAQNMQPTGPNENWSPTNIASNLTFATVPLTLGGASLAQLLAGDRNPAMDQADIQHDIPAIINHGTPTVSWRWYENGYDREPTDGSGPVTHNNYVSHHDGPQYFGYIANNANEQTNMRGEYDFFADAVQGKLPPAGVIYIRGGYNNIQGLKTFIQNAGYPRTLTPTDIATIQTAKAGDDDHPSYSDRQISEAMTARVVNTVASNPTLWAQSAIIITYDESDGFYDHVPPRILSYGPDGLPLARGVRVPMIVISPYARTHVVSHAEGDHNSVIETINAVFGEPALSTLPDEASALAAGNSAAFNKFGPPGFQQKYLGPRDTITPITDSLLSAFDPNRLRGVTPPLPASYAEIDGGTTVTLPHYGGQGCKRIGVVPEDQRQGISAPPPANFNPLAGTLPQYNIPAP